MKPNYEKMPKIFISHSSSDREMVKAFTKLIIDLTGLSTDDIFVSSDDITLHVGENSIEKIYHSLKQSKILFFIISENFLNSKFCLNEMGASWILDKKVIPVLTGRLNYDALEDTFFYNIHLCKYNVKEDLDRIRRELIANGFEQSIGIEDLNEILSAFINKVNLIKVDDLERLKINVKYAEQKHKDVISEIGKSIYDDYSRSFNTGQKEASEVYEKLEDLKDEYDYYDDVGETFKKVHPECRLIYVMQETIDNRQFSLLRELTNKNILGKRRKEIGQELCKLGDPRKGIYCDDKNIPQIEWIRIPSGEYYHDYLNEIEFLSEFYISKYTITQNQFKAFIDDKDETGNFAYNNEFFWDIKDEHKEFIKSRDEYEILFKGNYKNLPMVDVNWYEAQAFCRWLSLKINMNVRLPSSRELEKASRGGRRREFSYGNIFNSYNANTAESEIGSIIAVGMYPLGASYYGVHDVSGNVWQWTADEYSNIGEYINQGGSYKYKEKYARCHSTGHKLPTYRSLSGGFRIAVSYLDEI